KDGSTFWASVIITAIRDSSGELRGFSKVTKDITTQKAAEEALRHSEEKFRTMIEGVRDYAIIMLDTEGRVTSWNDGAEKIKGYTASEILGQSFKKFYPEEDLKAGKPEYELEVIKKVGRFEDLGWRVRKDGSRFWANVIITAIYD